MTNPPTIGDVRAVRAIRDPVALAGLLGRANAAA